jgi:hypothetical protein
LRKEESMVRIFIPLFLTFILAVSHAGTARAGMEAGIFVGEEGIRSFYLSVGQYYNVPEKEVIFVKKKRIPDEELSVVFFFAHRAGVKTSRIIDLRRGGLTWLDITLHFGLTPRIFYVPVKVVKGPPYGKAYGYYMKKPKKDWAKIVLTDVEIIDLVNLKFISEHYGYPAEEVIKMRRGGKTFVAIDYEAKKWKRGKEKRPVKNKGKGKWR